MEENIKNIISNMLFYINKESHTEIYQQLVEFINSLIPSLFVKPITKESNLTCLCMLEQLKRFVYTNKDVSKVFDKKILLEYFVDIEKKYLEKSKCFRFLQALNMNRNLL